MSLTLAERLAILAVLVGAVLLLLSAQNEYDRAVAQCVSRGYSTDWCATRYVAP